MDRATTKEELEEAQTIKSAHTFYGCFLCLASLYTYYKHIHLLLCDSTEKICTFMITLPWLSDHGVKWKIEEDDRGFPMSDCLLNEAKKGKGEEWKSKQTSNMGKCGSSIFFKLN